MKTKLPNNLLGILEDTGEQGEQGLEGEACLIMMSQSLLGKQASSIETRSAHGTVQFMVALGHEWCRLT